MSIKDQFKAAGYDTHSDDEYPSWIPDGHEIVPVGQLRVFGDRSWRTRSREWFDVAAPDTPIQRHHCVVVRPVARTITIAEQLTAAGYKIAPRYYPPSIPKGYEIVPVGECRQRGDRYWSEYGNCWIDTEQVHMPLTCVSYVCIRPSKPKTDNGLSIAEQIRAAGYTIAASYYPPSIPDGYAITPVSVIKCRGDRYWHGSTKRWTDITVVGERGPAHSFVCIRPIKPKIDKPLSVAEQLVAAGYAIATANHPILIPEEHEIVPVNAVRRRGDQFWRGPTKCWDNVPMIGTKVLRYDFVCIRPLQAERAAEQWCAGCGDGKEHADVAACPACWQSRTRLERVLLGWEADPYMEHRESLTRTDREVVTSKIVDAHREAEVFIAEQWGEEFEEWK